MAEVDFDAYGGMSRLTSGQVQRLANLTGAVASVGLILGVCVWGYQLAVRDVSGVPVIRAVEGPMRTAPANPGGEVADHQGMAINAIAAIGGAEDLPEEFVLAPSAAQLDPEDVAGLATLPVATAPQSNAPGPMPLEAKTAALAPLELAPGEVLPPSVVSTAIDPTALGQPSTDQISEDAIARALAEALGGEADAMPEAEDAPAALLIAPGAEDATAPVLTVPEAAVAGDSVPGQVRPRPRPDTLGTQTPSMDAQAAPLAIAGEIDPASLPVGTRLVQLGAFDTAELARGEWVKIVARFGDLMSGKSLVVEAAESGGRTFYRLRAHGFAGEDDVRRFCAALVAENAACIPAKSR